ncbi:cytochrome P450 2C5-like [Protobothrops mucrosquamatus]|uniref:cytochrome P450 2C5-like n=1 Tax=Protobothrops mucrosquamatus TaxID=103944 RepID=UPI0010FB9EC3|nr:cytochrome P450 2C5-like [Protobothrops mucrosquamatus]
MVILGWLIVLSLLFLCFWKNQRPAGFPPGPWRLPLLGNLLQFSKRDPLKILDQLRKKYGPVFSLYLGRTPVVFTHGFSPAKEVLVMKGIEFAGRADIPIIDIITNKKGIRKSYHQCKDNRLYNEVPLVRHLPLPHQTILVTAKEVDVFMKKEMEEHRATLTPGDPRDFTDAYLEEMQKKCWKEIDTVVGNKAILKYEDRGKLPYTNAVIHEIQRISNVVPLGLPHAAIKDVQLFGYKIPKDTMVFVNIQSAHHDESQWKFPNEFNPSNFLNEEGDFVKPEAFLAFSAGPRVCLGEILARMELFLFFTSILRNFQLSWSDKYQAPDFTPHFEVTQSPSRFKVLLKCRQLYE